MAGLAVKSALSPDKLGEGIDYDDGKHEAVDAVKHTPMAGHYLPTILDMRLAFDERFRQVSHYGRTAKRNAQDDSQVPGNTQRLDGT